MRRFTNKNIIREQEISRTLGNRCLKDAETTLTNALSVDIEKVNVSVVPCPIENKG